MPESDERMYEEVACLRPQEGDLLVFKVRESANQEGLKHFIEYLRERLKTHVAVMQLDESAEVIQVEQPVLRVKKLTPDATLPYKATPGAAGYDLCACLTRYMVNLVPGESVKVPTGIAVQIPTGYMGRILPRSGLAAAYGIDVLGGVIDSDYRGEVFVLLHHTGAKPGKELVHGERIAQLVLTRIADAAVQEVEELDDTERGGGGFGSTGR